MIEKVLKQVGWPVGIVMVAAIMLLNGCTYTDTYSLNEQQQALALKKYPASPGLNFVTGEPTMNTIKGVTRFILAPTTLFLSEAIIEAQREKPYKMLHNEIVRDVTSELAKKRSDFYMYLALADEYKYLDRSHERSFKDFCKKGNITDLSPEYWTVRYQIGITVVRTMLIKDKVKDEKTLNEILYSDNPIARDIRKQCYEQVKTLVRQKKAREDAEFDAMCQANQGMSQQNYVNGSTSLNLNAFGPGIHQNSFGQPVTLKPDFGGVPGEQLQIKENTYGPGVHSDQYGRPVREYSPW